MTQSKPGRRLHKWSPKAIEHFARMIETDEKLGFQHPIVSARTKQSHFAAALMPEEFDQWDSLNWHFAGESS